MKNAKIHTSTFFIEVDFLAEIDRIAAILGVSRSIVVERAVFGKEKGYENAQKYITPKKSKKEIPTKRGKYKTNKRKRKKEEVEQKCLFDGSFARLSYICV